MPDGRSNRVRHLIACGAGAIALLSVFMIPSGILGYLAAILIGVVAVVIGHSSVRLPGSFQWMAGVGLGIGYLELLFATSLLVVRLARTFSG